MNAKKWWAIPLIVVGLLGMTSSVYVSLLSGEPANLRLLVVILGNVTFQPLVWIGIGGLLLWRSGSRPQQASEETVPAREGWSEHTIHSEAGTGTPRPQDPAPRSVVEASRCAPQSRPAPVSVDPATSPSHLDSSKRLAGTALVLAILALVVAVGVGGYVLGTNPGSNSSDAPPAAATSLSSPSLGSTPSLSPSTTPQLTTTTTMLEIVEPPSTWSLPQFDGTITYSGSVADPWSQTSEPWIQYFEDEKVFTLEGIAGFQKVFDSCLEELCDYWLLGLENGDQQAWQVMGYLWSTQVLRYRLAANESVALCWSEVYDAPVVVTATVGAVTNRVMAVNRAWTLPGWYGDGLWQGLDPQAIDAGDVEPLPLRGGDFSTC